MSAAKPLPLPRDELISNIEIMEMTGFNLNRVNLLKAKPLFPKILCFSPARTALYKKAAVLEWFERFPQKTQKSRKQQVFKKPRVYKSSAQHTIFDNQLCVNFIIGKDKTKFPGTGKTTTVHINELNWG
jgi:hypothetical protein